METNIEGDDKPWLILGLSSSSKLSDLNENLKMETSNYLSSLDLILHIKSKSIPKFVCFFNNLGH